jgi:hypothetical protein
LARHSLVGSMSRKGNCSDNAVVKRFFLSLKTQRVWQRDYVNHTEAMSDIANYIVAFYNSVRLRLEPIEHRRCRLPLRIDPSAGVDLANCFAARCCLRRRLHDDWHPHRCRHGPHRTDAAWQQGALRRS